MWKAKGKIRFTVYRASLHYFPTSAPAHATLALDRNQSWFNNMGKRNTVNERNDPQYRSRLRRPWPILCVLLPSDVRAGCR